MHLRALAAVVAASCVVAIAAVSVHSNRPEPRVAAPVGLPPQLSLPAQPTIPEPSTTEAPPVTTEAPVITPVESPNTPVFMAPTPLIQVPPPVVAGNGDCANPVIPEWKARQESGCRWDAYNPTGCGGRGCLGFYQLDEGHFYAVSPWNSNASGGCADLAAVRWEPWAQTECASRLGPSAWGL